MKYKCSVCNYIYDESKTPSTFDELSEGWSCPICDSGKIYFDADEEEAVEEKVVEPPVKDTRKIDDLAYPSGFERAEDDVEKYMGLIHEMAKTGKSVISPMRSQLNLASWDDILVMGAQLSRFPLNEHDEVNTTTIIGSKAEKPLVIEHPIYITHMSFGALSKEFKMSLSKGSAAARTAMCSGEGGIIPESMETAYKYIFEYVPNKYSVTDENLMNADAIEIKIGQGTKPGMGGHLPGGKVTKEIAAIRGKEEGKDIISPSKFEDITGKEDLKMLVDELRTRSKGRPIGIKIAAGHIEDDLDVIAYANPDFVTIDGRTGGTGASPKLVKDATTVPTLYALYRAKQHMQKYGMDFQLVITGGLRVSSDFIKALAMGADAVAIGTAAMMATVCQQYRICNTGKCPVGCATQDPELRARLNMDNSAIRLMNYLNATLEELKTFARLTGHDDVHGLSTDDLRTTNSEVSGNTNILHV